MNELDVRNADVKNAFISAPCKEKVWLKAGPEFKDEQDKVFIIVRALYGLKSASASFRLFILDSNQVMLTMMFGCDQQLRTMALSTMNTL